MSESRSHDEIMMHKAIQLAQNARIISPPNPWVGCLLTKHGKVIGEGHTQAPGNHHAEIVALQSASEETRGATAYVTLEPCSHYGRTPPCTKALIEAGVARVVVGIEDPDTKVKGKGLAQLKEAGIEVEVGIHAEAVKRQLAPYLHQRTTGLPYCVGKCAISVDGRIGAKDGSSQWISSETARRDAHQLRAESQAILIGAGTAIADLPSLTVRHVERQPLNPPLRIVIDANGRVAANGPLFKTEEAPTLMITSPSCPDSVKRSWINAGAEIATLPNDPSGKGVDLHHVLEILGKRNIIQVLVEGGAALMGSFIEQHLIQHLRLYVGPCILGSEGLPLFQTRGITSLSNAPALHLLDTMTFGDTVRLDYKIV